MSNTYAPKQSSAQKKDAPTAASILDTSSQSESLQRKADMANGAAQRMETPRPNNTGMPDNLKSGIESLSGFSMDDVRVHYNSSKPATVQALAYTQGTDIHVAPGQEKHLPHEAWHVAQQMAGRVSPTTNINGTPVNDNAALEHEADVMGEKAVQCKEFEYKNVVPKTLQCFGRVIQCGSVKKNKTNTMRLKRSTREKSLMRQKLKLKRKQHPLNRREKKKLICKLESMEFRVNFIPKIIEDKQKPMPTKANIERILGPLGMVRHYDDSKTDLIVHINCSKKPIDKVGAISAISIIAAYLGEHFFQKKIPKGRTLYAYISSNYISRKGHPRWITLVFNFSDVYQMGSGDRSGYVICVAKKSNNPDGFIQADISNSGDDENNRYSVNHVSRTQGKSIFEETYRKVEDKGTEKFESVIADSYTKLAAEGARFQCVRRNIRTINDNTVFYDTEKLNGVTFSTLWNSWSTHFEKKYNISDETVREKIKLKKFSTKKIKKIDSSCIPLDGNSGDDITKMVDDGSGDEITKMVDDGPSDDVTKMEDKNPSERSAFDFIPKLIENKRKPMPTEDAIQKILGKLGYVRSYEPFGIDLKVYINNLVGEPIKKLDAISAISKIASCLGKYFSENEIPKGRTLYAYISSNYKSRKGNPKWITLVFNFSNVYQMGSGDRSGYVICVAKTSKNPKGFIQADISNSGDDENNRYSANHASRTQGKSIFEETYRKKEDKGTEKFKSVIADSYTKLAAEGARFQCIRENMDKVTDGTRIYVEKEQPRRNLRNIVSNGKYYWGVTFPELWRNWSKVFKKQYDVDNSTIAEAIENTVLFAHKIDEINEKDICVKRIDDSAMSDS